MKTDLNGIRGILRHEYLKQPLSSSLLEFLLKSTLESVIQKHFLKNQCIFFFSICKFNEMNFSIDIN